MLLSFPTHAMPCRTVLRNLAPACLLPTRGLLAQHQSPAWFRDTSYLPAGAPGAQCQPEGSDWYARGMGEGRDQCNAHYEQYGRRKRAFERTSQEATRCVSTYPTAGRACAGKIES
jgi:hypothetical protein